MSLPRAVWCRFGSSVSAVVFCLAVPFTASALEVRIVGVADAELAATLEGGSLLFEQAQSEEPVAPEEIVATAQADYRRLLAVLYDNGYFGPQIEIKLDGREAADILAVSPPSRVADAVITINPGRRFRFGVTEVAPLTAGTVLPEGFGAGETAGISVVQSAARAGIDGWRAAGHAKATVTDQQITARHQSATLDARLRINPGPRLRFGPLRVDGASAVRRDRIIEIAGLPEGQTYSPKELQDAAARLRRTGTFRSVALIEDEEVGPDGTLPVTARVADNKPRRFGFGGELATIEGLTLSGFWLHRNFFGGAESLRVDAEVGGIGGDTGGIDYVLRARYGRPATFNEDTNFFATTEFEQLDQSNFFSRQFSVGAGIERFASDERRYTLGVGLRRAKTRDFFGEDNYTLFLVPASVTFDYRDNDLDARNGYYADARLTPFLALSGTDSGLLTELDIRGYRSFGEVRPTTLALRAQLGSVAGPSLEDAPADFLFYSGGGGTVRGHEFESLGVRVGPGEDDIVGGRAFLGLSAELRIRTSGALGFVGFVDAGYIGREDFLDGSGEWQTGAGVGIRYATPIGPLRVDLAVPTSGETDGQDFQLYFGIGHSF